MMSPMAALLDFFYNNVALLVHFRAPLCSGLGDSSRVYAQA